MASEIPEYTLDIVRGDTLERVTFVMEDADGAHISYAGHTDIKAQVRVDANLEGPPLIELQCGVDVDGDLYVQATAEATAAVGAVSEAVWDIESTGSGKKHTRMRGPVEITSDVTYG